MHCRQQLHLRNPLNGTFNLTSIVLLGLLSVAVAHGHDGNTHMDMGESAPQSSSPVPVTAVNSRPESYFQYEGPSGLMLAHIILMTIAWVFILPIGVMLSISRSRRGLVVQLVFFIVNAVGASMAIIYNASTPDLYPNNAHHKLGWTLICVMAAQVALGGIRQYAQQKQSPDGFLPVSQDALAENQRDHDLTCVDAYRLSDDSGHGTASRSESLGGQPCSEEDQRLPAFENVELYEDDQEKRGFVNASGTVQCLLGKIPGLLPPSLLKALLFWYEAVDRVILLLGFVALATGGVTFGGLFVGHKVYSGLAHFIKGGIFFWYGILTLGRWAGCFAEIGWAWNIRSQQSVNGRVTSRPTAEFVESALIFTYGSTNVFLEHLAAWGKEWTAQDLEHVSLSIMFFGGGLCGMLIESKRIRDLLGTTGRLRMAKLSYTDDCKTLEEPRSYSFSMNPIPALVILLLGMMMSSHHQDSMVSTMIHSQWGMLLVGAAFARAATYVLFYLSPPTSIFPGRPPTELIASFCLMAGGMIFMASARDIVAAIELHNLDAMFVFTVSMGIITFLMAWVIIVIAIKGWAARQERRA